ncbi:MBL fold metallo-hydrolase [Kribbella sp. ALI-6-A]|uniref:MBL fold metallo-hydrolase n=1 Tax=Kribbella sp. ALI-6-A TaxID=1933817 RepID=UPI00097C8449|nr:MBL fold metallo-hydrolase [Kribbella sp. ALI-6-A]ONI72234.1 MBL fold metallo-hydrolase [Kribbella sp. ALI-6-A]
MREEKLQRVAGRVWVYPHDPDPDAIGAAVGVIADERGSVLIDAGNGPAHAREVRRAIEEAGLPAPRWLVYTHHHWDHTWGASVWDGVEVVAHASATGILAGEAERPWSHQYLRDQVGENPKLGPSFRARALAVPDFSELRIVLPHTTFEDTLRLPTGVQLRYVGGHHAPDSIVAVDPESDVMLLGDCYFPPPFHLRTEADTTDFAMARRLLRERHAYYVDSHSAPRKGQSAATPSG